MFRDLVGYTVLSEQLDPEDMRDFMATFQHACGAAIDGYDGHVGQCLGDGLMVYFGQPRAHEIDAERAPAPPATAYHDQGRGAEALETLSPILDWFTEGFPTGDLIAAHDLRAKLA
jgi:class 3 adenylate cyclase